MRPLSIKLYRDIAAADGKQCPYCGDVMIAGSPFRRKRPSRDHIKPRSAGFTFQRNKLICCQRCNEDKSSLTIWAWQQQLITSGDRRRAERVLEVIVLLYGFLGAKQYEACVGRQCENGPWYP